MEGTEAESVLEGMYQTLQKWEKAGPWKNALPENIIYLHAGTMQEILHRLPQILHECHGPPPKTLVLTGIYTGGILTTSPMHMQQKSDYTVILVAQGHSG